MHSIKPIYVTDAMQLLPPFQKSFCNKPVQLHVYGQQPTISITWRSVWYEMTRFTTQLRRKNNASISTEDCQKGPIQLPRLYRNPSRLGCQRVRK